MKHLTVTSSNIEADKILSNWATAAEFIYKEATVNDMLYLLRYEILNRKRDMIIDRLKTRLLSVIKQQIKEEVEEDANTLFAAQKGI